MKRITVELTITCDDDAHVDEYDIESALDYRRGINTVDVDSFVEDDVDNPADFHVRCSAVGCASQYPESDDFVDTVHTYEDAVEYLQGTDWEVSDQPGVTRGRFYCPVHAYGRPLPLHPTSMDGVAL